MRQVAAEKDRAITQLTKQIQELQEKIAAQTKELDAARKDLSDESVSKERQLNAMLEQIKAVNFESIQHQKTFAYEKQQIEIKYAKQIETYQKDLREFICRMGSYEKRINNLLEVHRQEIYNLTKSHEEQLANLKLHKQKIIEYQERDITSCQQQVEQLKQKIQAQDLEYLQLKQAHSETESVVAKQQDDIRLMLDEIQKLKDEIRGQQCIIESLH